MLLKTNTGIEINEISGIDPLENLDEYLAFISALDLIITVDNSTAHIGGALGIPTWVMLPYACEWRWMTNKENTLWYKSLRLYRQKNIGDWKNVIEEITEDLAAKIIEFTEAVNKEQTAKLDLQVPKEKKPTKKPPIIAFVNDTTDWYHWGCTATSRAIKKRIADYGHSRIDIPINHIYNFKTVPNTTAEFDDISFFKKAFAVNNYLYSAIDIANCVVINGEGSIHHLTPISLSLLYIAYSAKKFMGKNVQIINHSPYPENFRIPQDSMAFKFYKEIYNQLDYIAIREHISHKLMTDYGTRAELSFDCLPITVTEDYKPESLDSEKNIVISGSVSFTKERIADLEKLIIHFSQKGYKIKILLGAKAFPAQDDVNFVRELLKLDFKGFEVFDAKSLTEWLDCLNSAAVFVSGRFHHSLASIYLETPCVMMESNTLKNVAIAESFGLSNPIQFSSKTFLDELLERTEKAIASAPIDFALRGKLLKRSEVNFNGLKGL